MLSSFSLRSEDFCRDQTTIKSIHQQFTTKERPITHDTNIPKRLPNDTEVSVFVLVLVADIFGLTDLIGKNDVRRLAILYK